MEQSFLNLKPKRFLCPCCGEWHVWNKKELGIYDSEVYTAIHRCSNGKGDFGICFTKGDCFYRIKNMCIMSALEGYIPISSRIESEDKSIVVFCDYCVFVTDDNCKFCDYKYKKCKPTSESLHKIDIKFGFEFEQSEDNKIAKAAVLEHKKKGDSKMAKTTFLEQLYEHSPKENVEKIKEWSEKYKSTLKWVIPVLSIYGAYRVLNTKGSPLTVDNIDSECEKKLGFSMECLKDKKALGELLVLGGFCTGAYAVIKAVSTMNNKEDNEDISVENIEECLNELESKRKKWGFIQSKTENLLPIAVSVIIVYVMTQKPVWFETVKEKVNKFPAISVYGDLAKSFVAQKLNINLEKDEEVQKFKKFAFLAFIVGIGVFLYGTNILKKKEDEEQKLNILVNQILSIMRKLMPTAFAALTTFLITKKVVKTADSAVDCEWSFEEDEKEDKEPDNVVDAQ